MVPYRRRSSYGQLAATTTTVLANAERLSGMMNALSEVGCLRCIREGRARLPGEPPPMPPELAQGGATLPACPHPNCPNDSYDPDDPNCLWED